MTYHNSPREIQANDRVRVHAMTRAGLGEVVQIEALVEVRFNEGEAGFFRPEALTFVSRDESAAS